jgi:hypothetical protein
MEDEFTPSYDERSPRTMTRKELVTALHEWLATDDTRLDVIVDLIEASLTMIEHGAYLDGSEKHRCRTCLQLVSEERAKELGVQPA